MTTRHAPETDQRQTPAYEGDIHPATLVGEHALLLRAVRSRAAPVLTLAEAQAWPEVELGTLTEFLRSTVLRQASDEEVLLYPNGSSAPFAELTADHVRLHTLTDQLERADVASCPLPELRRLVEQLLTVLERHLVEEQAVLAALPDTPADVPSAADLAAGTQAWLAPSDEPVLILLDALPHGQGVQLCVERLLRLRPGQTAEIHARAAADLRRVCQWMLGFDAARYGFEQIRTGSTHPALRVTRRHAP
jgi:hypothetical protein